MNKLTRMIFYCSLLMFVFCSNVLAAAQGIYVTQWNLENTAFIQNLIRNAKASGINTFVVDLEVLSKRYDANIALVRQSGLSYVARIIMFPDGGTKEQIKNPAYWQRKFALVQHAVDLGAQQIQLDYIRYKASTKASPENSKDILAILQWYKSQLVKHNVPLQIDVFGITAYGESKHIGQNVKLFSNTIDAVCPMVYPSHYTPFSEHVKTPYKTVYNSLSLIKKQFNDKPPIKVYAYIELSNYHFPMSRPHTLEYIKAQLKAVSDAGVDGWYAWSPHNRYDNLFRILQNKN